MASIEEQAKITSADFKLAAHRKRPVIRHQKGVEQDRPGFRPKNADTFARSPLASHLLSSAESTSNGS